MKILFEPPYVSLIATTRSPESSKVNSALLMAAIPVEKLAASSPPSKMRIFSSRGRTVGLVWHFLGAQHGYVILIRIP